MNPMANMELQRRSEIPAASNSREKVRASTADDKAMLKAAAGLTRDLNQARSKLQFSGLTGPVILARDGSRTIGTTSLWGVQDEAIIER